MEYPDEVDVVAQLTLQEFLGQSQQMFTHVHDDSRSEVDFIRFILAGRVGPEADEPEGPDRCRISLNAQQGINPLPPHPETTITRDIDSIIGVSHSLPYTTALSVWPVPPFKETLQKDNHIKGKAYDAEGDEINVSMHKIPNVPLGKVEQRHVVRIFFPRLYAKASEDPRWVGLSQDDFAIIYDRCLRPLIIQYLPETRDRWPTSYNVALTHARTLAGSIAFNTVDVAWRVLEQLAGPLLTKLGEEKEEFKDAYFVHELRGKKNAAMHDGTDPIARQMALDDVFEHVDTLELDPRQWHVDVALTIGLQGCVVTWRSSSHQEILNFLMPGAGPQRIDRLTNNKTAFHFDRHLQIKEFAGFRASTANVGGADGISYVQAYCTEKNVTYSLSPGVFRRRRPKELLNRKTEEKVISDLDIMSDVFFECTGDGSVAGRDGCARLEIRVPLDKALDCLPTIPEDLAQRSVIAIDRRAWWYFVYYRLAAIRLVLVNLSKADAKARSTDATLALGAVCIYMLNACFTRPAEGFGWEKLIETTCQHVLEDSDDDDDEDAPTMPVLYDSGTYFICDIVLNSSRNRAFLRLPLQRSFDSKSMARIYQADSMAAIKSSFSSSWIIAPSTKSRPNPERTNNRKRKTRDVDDIREPDRQRLRLATEISGIRFKAPVRLAGRDVDMYVLNGGDAQDLREEDEEDEEESDLAVNRRAAKIYEQFFVDVIEEAPNRRSRRDGSYLSIPVRMRAELARPTLLQTTAIPFNQAQYCVCTSDQWRMHFDRFFPETAAEAALAAQRQNFKKCTYFHLYVALAEKIKLKSLRRTRRALWKEFETLAWVPFTQSDRMWTTKPMAGRSWKTLPPRERGGPLIAINPRFQRTPVTLRSFEQPDESDGDEASSDEED